MARTQLVVALTGRNQTEGRAAVLAKVDQAVEIEGELPNYEVIAESVVGSEENRLEIVLKFDSPEDVDLAAERLKVRKSIMCRRARPLPPPKCFADLVKDPEFMVLSTTYSSNHALVMVFFFGCLGNAFLLTSITFLVVF